MLLDSGLSSQPILELGKRIRPNVFIVSSLNGDSIYSWTFIKRGSILPPLVPNDTGTQMRLVYGSADR